MSDKDKTPYVKTDKLFVLIAQKDSNKASFEKMLDERCRTFEKKQNHFTGINKTFTSKVDEIDEDDSKYVDGSFNTDRFPNEFKAPITSVDEQLAFMAGGAIDYMNTVLSIEKTNTAGIVKANLVIGTTVLGSFSSSELLSLRNFIREYKKVYAKIPTYDPNGDWLDKKTEDGWYQSSSNKSVKGRQIKDWKIVAPANQFQKEAQVKEFTKELIVGITDTTNYTTMYSPKQKNDLLQRTQILLEAIDIAIKKANDIASETVTESVNIMNFLHKGTL